MSKLTIIIESEPIFEIEPQTLKAANNKTTPVKFREIIVRRGVGFEVFYLREF